jgi:hypothetical protein
MLAFEQQVGRPMLASRIYDGLDNFSLDTKLAAMMAKRNGLMYVNVASEMRAGCVSWSAVAGGRYDAYLHKIASQIHSYGHIVYFSWNHEPLGDCTTGTAADYVRSYAHVRSVIAGGATNVRFVWTPSAGNFRSGKAAAYEPAQYDFVGVDGYTKAGDWVSAAEVFGAAHDFAVKRGKPLFIGEIGCAESPKDPAAKGKWIAAAGATFRSWGDVRGMIWSNTVAKSGNYWVTTSTASLNAFRALAADPFYRLAP